MKTKKIFTGILSTVLSLSLLTACSGKTDAQSSKSGEASKQDTASEQSTEQISEKSTKESTVSDQSSADETSKQTAGPGSYTLTIRDPGKNSEITATFFNNITGASEDVKMEKTGESGEKYIFTCTGDTEKYNVFHLSYGDTVTKDAAFNKCVSGMELFEGELLPYDVKSSKDFELKYDTKTFQIMGLEKKVYIWTPDDYDANSADKYSTIYMLDGQTVLTTEIGGSVRSWNVAEHTASMISATGNKAILVCLDAGEMRDDDYSPRISKDAVCKSSSNPCGNVFADYVCNTVMPYIQENYNVYTDAAHNSIAGSSMGGLECFYIGMDHSDKFGTAGVFSPSLWAYGEEDWKKYISEKTYGDSCAFLYFYSGGYGGDAGALSEPIYNSLIEAGYPKDKLVFSKNETGEHKEEYWSLIYPEFLEAAMYGKVSALESGVPVKYTDRTVPDNLEMLLQAEASSNEPDNRPDYIKNYVFFDNSEMKWDNVYAYWFAPTQESPINKETGEPEYGNPMWPGLQMEKIEGTEIYRIVAPVAVSAIIFSNGILDRDVKKGVTAYQTADLLYSDAACSGKIYTIDTSVPAKQGTGVEKTKFAYPAGKWVDYES